MTRVLTMKSMGESSRTHYVRTIAVMMITGALLSTVAKADGPNPHEVTIRNLTALGSGCPAGTVASLLSEDQRAFTLFFSDFAASAGPYEPITNQYKTCNIQLDLDHPHSWQYAIIGVDYRGYAALDRNVTASLRTQYWLQGSFNRPIQFRRDLSGPHADEFLAGDQIAESQLVYSPCSVKRALNLKASIAVRSTGRGAGLVTVDSIDGELKHTYRIRWRRCY